MSQSSQFKVTNNIMCTCFYMYVHNYMQMYSQYKCVFMYIQSNPVSASHQKLITLCYACHIFGTGTGTMIDQTLLRTSLKLRIVRCEKTPFKFEQSCLTMLSDHVVEQSCLTTILQQQTIPMTVQSGNLDQC